MAELFSDEGLTLDLNIWPRKNVALPADLYLGTFTAATASTTPARTVVMDAAVPITGVTEPTSGTGAYARKIAASAGWGAPSLTAGGVKSVSAQISFDESTAAWSPATQNGFFICQQLAQGAGTKGIGYANFDDLTAVAINAAGFVLRVTATWEYLI